MDDPPILQSIHELGIAQLNVVKQAINVVRQVKYFSYLRKYFALSTIVSIVPSNEFTVVKIIIGPVGASSCLGNLVGPKRYDLSILSADGCPNLPR